MIKNKKPVFVKVSINSNLRQRLPGLLSALALALTVAASLWIALQPAYYTGISVIGVPGEAPREATGLTASFIEMNGLWGVFTLLVPVFITLAGFLVSFRRGNHTKVSKVTMWAMVVLLLLFCGAGILSIGAFYLPAAIALFAGVMFYTISRKKIPQV